MGHERLTRSAPDPVPTGGVLRRIPGSPLRVLVTGQCLSQGADGLAQIAFAHFFLFDVGEGATPGRIATVLAVTLLPFSVVGPFAGVLLDRYDRRRLMIASDLVRAATFAILPFVA